MEIQLRLSERQAADDLLDFFQRREMPARRVQRDCVAVQLPEELQERQARHELELLLRVWQLMHPNVGIDVL
jgi:hypothetical protein